MIASLSGTVIDRNPWLRALPAVASMAVFAIALVVLHRLTSEFHPREVLATVRSMPIGRILAACLFTAASYAALTFYDVLALRHIARRLRYRMVAVTSFTACAVGHSVGVATVSAGAIRYRMYSLAGLDAAEIAQVIAFCAVTLHLSAGVLIGLSLVGEAGLAASLLHGGPVLATVLGGTVLTVVAAYLALTVMRRKPFSFGGWRFAMPGPGMTLVQLALGTVELMLACAALYVLLPVGTSVSFLAFLGLYMVAMVAGAVSTVPGGLGVFESVLLLLLVGVRGQDLLGALLVYRAIYYVAPFAAAILLMTASELRQQQVWMRRVLVWTRRSLGFVVPQAMSMLAFGAGAVLLVSGATPAVVDRLRALEQFLPLPVLELSHLAGSAIGIALLILARGLYFRLDAAWHLMLWLLGAGVVASLLKGLDWEEALLLVLVLLPLIATRREFYRRASLLTEPLSPRWLAAVAMAIGASIWIGLLAQRQTLYRNELWWQFAFDASAPRMLRASLVAMLVFGALATLRLLRPSRPRPAPPAPDALQHARIIIRGAADAGGHLALLGDKSLLFSESGATFLMYGVAGHSRVAMGDPVGPVAEHAEMVWRFRELCDREGGWCVFYEVRPGNLAIYVDAGLSLTKIGEEARVALERFSLEGSTRAPLRQAVRRVEREGAVFHVVAPADLPPLLPQLRAISEDWLAAKSASEKGFSLGFFDERYLIEGPCAIVERNGRPVAFANLWVGEDRQEFSIDLMRYSQDAPKGVMDYLFAQVMLWGRAEGYAWFSLGMAPLAGLEDHRLAPAWHKLGRLVYRYGENFYNFEGLRRYKDKFLPEWRPRYLATPSGMVLARVLLDVTRLISRDPSGLVREQRRAVP